MREFAVILSAVGLCLVGNAYAQEHETDKRNDTIECALDESKLWDDCFPEKDVSVNSVLLIRTEPVSLLSFVGLNASPWAPNVYDLILLQKEPSYEIRK